MNYGTKQIKLFVYAGDHPPPHCHLVRADKSVTRVALPSLIILSGLPLSKDERSLVLVKMEILCTAFDSLNPTNR
jgi:hypothetical protein